MATVDLRRPRRLYGALSAYRVGLDGESVGRLTPGGAISFEAGVGQHSLVILHGRRQLARRLVTVDSRGDDQRFVVLATNNPVKLIRSLLPTTSAGMVSIDPEAR